MELFKVLDKYGQAFHGGKGSWNMPQNGEPGDWMPAIEGDLFPCENGYHLCREQDLIQWLGPTIWAAEYRGERIDCDDKIVVREARLIHKFETWNEQSARLFACDCAERVIHLCDDNRSHNAIVIARQYAIGKATKEELLTARDAARAAAWAAAWDAAWAAARAAARSAQLAAPLSPQLNADRDER